MHCQFCQGFSYKVGGHFKSLKVCQNIQPNTNSLDLFMFQKSLPINNDENDPFIVGLERTIMATIFPTKPNTETSKSSMPMMNLNVGVSLGFEIC